jgi:hypothetical protein
MPDVITFEQLPVQKDGPPFNAWGLYGDKDELGRLNLITPEAIKRGRDEIRHGLVINLKWANPHDRRLTCSVCPYRSSRCTRNAPSCTTRCE